MAPPRTCGAPFDLTPDGIFWILWITNIIITSLLSLFLLILLCVKFPHFSPSTSKSRYRTGRIAMILVVMLFMVQGFIITGGLECSEAPLFSADAWIPWFVYGLQGLLVVVCIYLVRLLKRKCPKAEEHSDEGIGNGKDEEQRDSGSNPPAADLELEHVNEQETAARASDADAITGPSEREAANSTHTDGPSPIPLPVTQQTARRLYERTTSQVTDADWQHAIRVPTPEPQSGSTPEELAKIVSAARSLAADAQGFPFPPMPEIPSAHGYTKGPVRDMPRYPSLTSEDSTITTVSEQLPALQRCPPRFSVVPLPTPPDTPAAAPCA